MQNSLYKSDLRFRLQLPSPTHPCQPDIMPGLSSFLSSFFGNPEWLDRGSRTHVNVSTLPRPAHQMNSGTAKALPDDPNMYHVQTRSVLISKLPVEIRNIIWTYLMGNNTLHLFYEDANTLRSCICSGRNILSCASAAHGREGLGGNVHWTGRRLRRRDSEVRDQGCMGALSACRAL